MSVSLYRKGTTHTIRGTLCEMGKFSPGEVHTQLKNGWFKSPGEAYGIQDEKAKADEETHHKEDPTQPDEEEATEDNRVLNLDDMSNKEIREAAKAAGIESWDTTRIKTLKAELS